MSFTHELAWYDTGTDALLYAMTLSHEQLAVLLDIIDTDLADTDVIGSYPVSRGQLYVFAHRVALDLRPTPITATQCFLECHTEPDPAQRARAMTETTSPIDDSTIIIDSTTRIVAAYLANPKVEVDVDQIPGLIVAVREALVAVPAAAAEPRPELAPRGPPAVPIADSVTPDYIVCLEDGKRMTLLKQHLRQCFGMTPEDYRARWGLPPDYPMAAPNYSAFRSKVAKAARFGQKMAQRQVTRRTSRAA